MIEIEEFFTKLKECMEEHSRRLRNGQIFLPQYLQGGKFTKAFEPVARSLAQALNLRLSTQVPNRFPEECEVGGMQRIDFVFRRSRKESSPFLFLELESLDGSQLFHFREHRGVRDEDNWNKLWYYYGTLGNHYTLRQKVPTYFVWLLILPDHRVRPYQIWDATAEYEFFDPSLKELVYENPYRVYDYLIKASARLFVKKERWFIDPRTRRSVEKQPRASQDVCELVFITCTGDRLLMSRGKDLFDPSKERCIPLNWRNGPRGA